MNFLINFIGGMVGAYIIYSIAVKRLIMEVREANKILEDHNEVMRLYFLRKIEQN